MSGTGKASLRARLAPLLGGRATDFVATQLLREGSALWSSEPHRVQEAIDKVEQAWGLTRDPQIAIQLATMYDRANRNDDALVVLRQAFRGNPDHALLRHHAAITLLRHGDPGDIREFFESVLKVDAQDAFARFVMTLLDQYDGWVAQLASSIERKRDGRQPFVISLPVWGETYSAYCERFFCASLLSPNNLPALARNHSIHIAVFTTAESEQALRAKPLFCRLEEYATVDFIHYPAELVDYRAAMQAGYGDEKVHYSENSLAFYYERNCKFALMSCAHYVALAAGRATDAFVSCLVADLALNDGALLAMADRMSNADAVLAHAIQMRGKVLRPLLEQRFRGADGILQLSPDSCARLVIEHIPIDNLADAGRSIDPPLRIAWRVGDDGLLIHGNHYHPFLLRPKAFDHPLRLSIDPVDSRFIDRTSLDDGRITIVQDTSIVCLGVDDDPILDALQDGEGGPSVPRFALWLWGYWGRLRGRLFRSPLRYGSLKRPEEWQRVEAAAASLVDAIVTEAGRLEEANRARKSWRL
jgi:tetratricopeptide (TPR) repeat protein